MTLQQEYRTYQAELNSMKHEIESAVQKDTREKNLEYVQKLDEYKNKMSVADALLTSKKKEELEEISKLKIIIPDSLKGIYDKVQNLGKGKK